MTDGEVQYFIEVGCIIRDKDGNVKSEEWEKTPISESLARTFCTREQLEDMKKEALKDGNNS
jgi:hypothetical protein